MTRPLASAFAIAAVVFGSTTALAYRTGSDLPELAATERVRFEESNVRFSFYADLPLDVRPSEVEEVILAAGRTWSEPECTALAFRYDGTTTSPAEPGDGRNTIQWLFDWTGLDPDAAGATDVQYVTNSDGEWTIAEADLYLNGEFQWTTGTPAEDSTERSVLAVVTHELGHALGLLHNCEPNGEDGAPECSSSPRFEAATMYPFYGAGQSELSSDDVAGLCFLYPAEQSPTGDSSCPGESCSDPPLLLGEACDHASDCADGRCLAGTADEPFCTRACGGTNSPCPKYWSCEPASGEQVCVPATVGPAAGCSIAGGTGARRGSFPLFLLGVFVWGFRGMRFHRREK